MPPGCVLRLGSYSDAFDRKVATVPGKRISDLQVNKYKALRGEHSQEAAAAKTGISVASARRAETAQSLPSQRPARHWRTRADPLAEVWATEVVPMLEGAPSLMAVTLLEELQRRHPERFADSVLRTLQRRVGAPRRFVWNPTVRINGRRRARWACGQAAFEPVHMSTGRLPGARF